MRTTLNTYNSLTEFQQATIAAAESPRFEEDAPHEWNGNASHAQAAEMLHLGWHDADAEINAVARHIVATATKTFEHMRPAAAYSVEGGCVDVGSFLSGEPECMVTYLPQPGESTEQVVTMLVGYGALADVAPETLVKRGAAIVALADALATTGRTLEVWGESTAQSAPTWQHSTLVRIKAAGQPLNVGRLAMALCHPAMLRQLTFADRCGNGPARNGNIGGTCANLHADTVGATINLDPCRGNWPPQVADPVGWVTETMEAIANNRTVHCTGGRGY